MATVKISEADSAAVIVALRPLFDFMTERGMRRTWLAKRLGVTRQIVWAYEHGRRIPPPGFAAAACALVGLPLSFLGNPPTHIPQKRGPKPKRPVLEPVPYRPASRRLTAHADHTTKPASDGRASRR